MEEKLFDVSVLIISGLFGVLTMILLYTVNQLSKTLRNLRQDLQQDNSRLSNDINGIGKELNNHKVHVASNYVSRSEHKEEIRELHNDMKEIRDRISEGLGKVYEKIENMQDALMARLDQKADK